MEMKDEGAVENGCRREGVDGSYGAKGSVFEVAGVPCVGPAVGQGWGPSRGVDPMDGTREWASGWDFIQAIAEVVKKSHPC